MLEVLGEESVENKFINTILIDIIMYQKQKQPEFQN